MTCCRRRAHSQELAALAQKQRELQYLQQQEALAYLSAPPTFQGGRQACLDKDSSDGEDLEAAGFELIPEEGRPQRTRANFSPLRMWLKLVTLIHKVRRHQVMNYDSKQFLTQFTDSLRGSISKVFRTERSRRRKPRLVYKGNR